MKVIISLICFTFICALNASSNIAMKGVRKCPQTCDRMFRCDPYFNGPPTWALDAGVCKLFKSNCVLDSENCQRQNKCIPKLMKTTKEICQKFCSTCENVPKSPVCSIFSKITVEGEMKDDFETFSNQCELDKWSCHNAYAYIYATNGTCPTISKN
ncbi:uncharacterized protein LOC119681840 [Teleopsis dalmanni]|uniref:uncharacterized protein LOC119681840 n=1 Tax=Teleopsis dalmanni TaxID=139649 RepID=UPI0018CDABE2|nr:uncharacterized protein LOC119681840 [Teleopsis dalmanni]